MSLVYTVNVDLSTSQSVGAGITDETISARSATIAYTRVTSSAVLTGPKGVGVPTGGTTGQVLAKIDGTDYNTEWVDQSGGGGSSAWGDITGTLSNQTDLQTALDGKASTSHAHAVNDLSDVTITTPSTGQVLKYNGSAWVNGTDSTGSGGGGDSTWGSITGTLSDQTDLQTALDGKLSTSGGTITAGDLDITDGNINLTTGNLNLVSGHITQTDGSFTTDGGILSNGGHIEVTNGAAHAGDVLTDTIDPWFTDTVIVNGRDVADDGTKLDGIEAGATANSSDATLLARANHTGTQAASTITGLATVATSGDYTDLSNTPDLTALNDVVVEANLAAFPTTGDTDHVYIAEDTGYMYRWNGSSYTQLTDQTAIWGQITGTLSSQTDLQSALDEKLEASDIADFETTTELNARDTANRSRTNHTGTQTASTISDFDTEVSNNTDVAANTAARHTHSNKTTLDAITAAFTTSDETKLDGIEAGAQVNTVTPTNTTTLTNKDLSSSTNTFPDFYPIGTLYINKTNSANPSTYLPGMSGTTWVAIEDYFIMAAGPTYPGGTTGGDTSHAHGLADGWANIVLGASVIYNNRNTTQSFTHNYSTGQASAASSGTVNAVTTLGGSSDSANHIPPFQTAYVWERTA